MLFRDFKRSLQDGCEAAARRRDSGWMTGECEEFEIGDALLASGWG